MESDLWGDDTFDEADIEETFLKASQMESLGHVGASKSTVVSDQEKREIEDLLEAPDLIDDFFNDMEGIDPDLLSSQTIPGTQPRQRMIKSKGHPSSPILKTPKTHPTFPKTSTSKGVTSFGGSSLGNSSGRQASSNFSMPPPAAPGNIKSSPQKIAAQHKSSVVAISRQNSSTLSRPLGSSRVMPTQSGSSQRGPLQQDNILLKKLKESEESVAELKKEILTKKGEVCFLNAYGCHY